MTLTIEKNIPLPNRSQIPKLPLDQMAEGDSVLVPAKTEAEKGTLRQRLNRFKSHNPSMRFSMLKVDAETVRIFRLEDNQ